MNVHIGSDNRGIENIFDLASFMMMMQVGITRGIRLVIRLTKLPDAGKMPVAATNSVW